MHMEDVGGASTFMKIVHILGHDLNVKMFLGLGNGAVRRIWVSVAHLVTAEVIKLATKV